MPTIRQSGTEYTVSQSLASLHAVASRQLNGKYSPAGWARQVLAANKQEQTPEAVKRLGGQFRQQLWRDSENGCGRSGRYPDLTGSDIVIAIVNDATLEATRLRSAQHRLLSQGRKVAQAAAKSAKATSKAGAKVTPKRATSRKAAKPATTPAPASAPPVEQEAPLEVAA